ncbi:MAG: FliA/WhiG family RNA polymerase sigma factor [Defluviitaleaceae bacterium]|nr:FliA/WhiG family RNA polymerase sigma factor [Defluviitaleaceae bacterium]
MSADPKLFKEYKETKSKVIKDDLILSYAPLVKYVAGRLHVQLGGNVEYDDLVSYGILGLIDAIEKFDYLKGVKFETYASLRIKGAIIDSIRKVDWVPRSVRQKSKQLELAYEELSNDLLREPTEKEIADKLGIKEDEVIELIGNHSALSLVYLDSITESGGETANILKEPSDSSKNPEASYMKQELSNILVKAIENLTEKEKSVVTLYYFEELTLKEIGKVLEVSESRVSQLHSKAMLKLRGKLGAFKSILETV